MKRLGIVALTSAMALLAVPSTFAQKVEISPYYGYQFGDSFAVSRGEVKISGSANWGFTFDVEIEDELKFEFWYSRADTELRFRQFGDIGSETLFDVSVEYFHGGILYEVDATDAVRGFFTATAGVSRFDPKVENVDAEYRFSIAGGAGAKVFVSDNFGFRFQGRLLFPVLATSGGFGCGLPGGCFVGISTWSTLSADVTAGVVIAF